MTDSTIVERRRLRARRALFAVTTALCSGLAAPAFADSPHPNVDVNGVDLTTGEFTLALPIVSIGSGQARMPLIARDGQTDNWTQTIAVLTQTGSNYIVRVRLGTFYDEFTIAADGTATSSRGTGATLSWDGNNAMTYRTLDGTVISLSGEEADGSNTNLCSSYNKINCAMLTTSMSDRSHLKATFNWLLHYNCATIHDPVTGAVNCSVTWRLASVTNNAGYRIAWAFASNNAGGLHVDPGADWFRRTSATLQNLHVAASSWPTVTYGNPSSGVYTITTPAGETWRITGSGTAITAVRRPTASSDTTTVSYTSGQVSSVTNNGITTNYARSVSGSTATMVVTDALSNTTTIVSDMTKFRPAAVTDALSRTTSFVYDTLGRSTEITYPEGNKVQYGYDGRGNLNTTTLVAKSGSGLSNIVTSANFAPSCTDASCNEPITTTDARGNVTDYAYDATTGLPTSVTAPAATSGAKRPQTRYSYTTNAAGVALRPASRNAAPAPSAIAQAASARRTRPRPQLCTTIASTQPV